MLKLSGVSAGYGDLLVLRQVDLEVRAGEFVALLGSNAAGKSTLMRTITGLLPRAAGHISFEDQPLDGLPPYAIADRGLAVVLEHSVLPGLSVHENLVMGAYRRSARPRIATTLDEVFALFPVLAERRNQMAVSLSGGEQQMLCIGRALMSQPRLLALDEPSVGLSPAMVSLILRALADLNRQGLTILLVEQNVAQTLRVANRAYVMEGGSITLEGPAAALLDNPSVKAAYLGI